MELFSNYGTEIIGALAKYLGDPDQFCSLIGTCSGGTSKIDAFDNLQTIWDMHASMKMDADLKKLDVIF